VVSERERGHVTQTAQGDTPPAGGGRALLLLLAGCSALGPVSNLLVLPALPVIRAEFGVSTAATQTVISSSLIAFAFGILLGGPMSDRYGRRPAMISGLLVFTVGTLLCVFAPTLSTLVIGRVIQALGASMGLVVARAVVSDLYRDWRLAQALANLTLFMMAGTTVSPYLGGLGAEYFGWHSVFAILLAAGGLILFAAWRALPETRPADAGHQSLARLAQASTAVLRNRTFFACALESSVIYSVYIVFISVAPYVMSEMLGRPATEFGLWVLLLSAGYFAGNLYISRRGSALNMARLARLGSLLQAGSAVAALLFVVAGFTHPAFWFLPMLPLAVGQGLSLPHVMATAVQLSPANAGVASSLIGFSQQAVTALSVQAMGFAPTGSPLPVLTFCAAMSLLSLATLRRVERTAR
jgi:DHA1 family bicyclomycin/chloramphenicol resistance-like MFS transporter